MKALLLSMKALLDCFYTKKNILNKIEKNNERVVN